MQNTVSLHTLGCKVSQYETEAIREAFILKGFEVVPFPGPADVYVINTCTVTRESDRKSRQMIRKAIEKNQNAVVMVIGCYSQTSPDEVATIEGVDYIGGSGRKMDVVDMAIQKLNEKTKKLTLAVTEVEKEPFEPMCVKTSERTRAYIKIEDGCECRCTYCAIPGARGLVRSKPIADVLKEIHLLELNGTQEIVLTGIETASYGKDLKEGRLIDLLERIEEECQVPRIRLGSLTPELFTKDFVNRLAKLHKVAPHFHISMQSGSDHVLQEMKRRYSRKMALDAIQRLKEAIPNIQFTTDMMVGFPGETNEDFLDTMNFSKEVHFLSMHVFVYSRRKNTPAAEYEEQVPSEIGEKRSHDLQTLAQSMTKEILQKVVEEHQVLSVLFETDKKFYSVGHTDSFIEVHVKNDGQMLHGQILSVCACETDGKIIIGNIIR